MTGKLEIKILFLLKWVIEFQTNTRGITQMHKLILLLLLGTASVLAQDDLTKVTVRVTKAAGNVYFLDCDGGFGGGNVAASVGDDGILMVDDMFAVMAPKIQAALKTVSDKPVKIILNTHFHGDHIQGNRAFRNQAVIIGQENIAKRIMAAKDYPRMADLLPQVTFYDRISLIFNGEEVQMIHFTNSHTDSDSIVYFTKSKVLHLGDMFFFGMFPAVYTEGGGNIRQLVRSLSEIVTEYPPETKVVPGHGSLATMQDLKNYLNMIKDTIGIVDGKIKQGETLDQMKAEKVLAKYDALGSGGAQTTDQYLAMLYKLLSGENH
jgi:glyoxylase-like metal-dependent hydrolase (beta-lactamase superfamily II)